MVSEVKKMESLEITTCIGCKNMCRYCPQDVLLKNYKSKERIMSFETFKKCIDKLPSNVIIGFCGFCEAWQNPKCTDMLEYAHKKGHKITIFSTLIGMTLKDWERIEKIPIKEFWIHFPDKTGFMNAKFDDKYIELIKRMKVSKKIGINALTLLDRVHPTIRKHIGDVHIKTLLNSRAGNLSNIPPYLLKGKIWCKIDQDLRHGILLPNGDVALCCMNYNLSHILGNLLTMKYEDLFKSKAYKHILKGFKDETMDIPCRKCTWAKEDKNYKYNFTFNHIIANKVFEEYKLLGE